MPEMVFYKIRNKRNPDLFRMADGRWNKSGKTYDTLGKLRTVITQTINSGRRWHRDTVEDWEIVEYRVEVAAVKDIHEVMDPKRFMELLAK